MSSVSRSGSSLSRRGGQRTGEAPNSDCGLAVAQGVVLATGQGRQRGPPVRFAVFAAEALPGSRSPIALSARVDIIRKRAEHLGTVEAASEKEAIEKAAKRFDIPPDRRNRITVQKISKTLPGFCVVRVAHWRSRRECPMQGRYLVSAFARQWKFKY
jgi:hypothetical protein